MSAAHAITVCWHCGEDYRATDRQCPHCCATNGNVDLVAAQAEAEDPKGLIQHSYRYIKDCEGDPGVINGLRHFEYYECRQCGHTKNGPPPERDPDHDREQRRFA